MRSMLQLLGGVAVAGAVAAGATAFTASGVTATGVKLVGGGSTSINVIGAVVSSANLITDASDRTHITGVTLEIKGSGNEVLNTTNTVVQVTATGTATGTPAFTCTGSASTWTCNIGTPASNYYTDLSSINITVAPAL